MDTEKKENGRDAIIKASSFALQKGSNGLVKRGLKDIGQLLEGNALASTGGLAIPIQCPKGMVEIPAGTNSGTNPIENGEEYSKHYPEKYSLTVDRFFMDKTPVTKAQWDEVYNWAVAHGYDFEYEGEGKVHDHPVHTVNWYDVVKWCNARSEKEGRTPVYTVSGNVYRTGQSSPSQTISANGYRLPTVTEHQYASRGGLVGKRFPWGDTINHSYANYRANGSAYSYDTSPYITWTDHPTYNDGVEPYTSPVGSFVANGYGLYDMAGNVWEWCWDVSDWGSNRCVRGGSWDDYASGLRCGDVSSFNPHYAYYGFGFRAVCR